MTYILRDSSFFEQQFVELYRDQIENSTLCARITELDLAPRIDLVRDNLYQIILDTGTITADAAHMKQEEILDGLCILFGYGFVKPNYRLPIFRNISPKEYIYAIKLATEIWDRQIHMNWMHNERGHTQHNESKTLEFCKLLAKDRVEEAKEMHKQFCHTGQDTPHHISEIEFIAALESPNNLLREVFEDQASITGRYFKKAEANANKTHISHYDTQDNLMNVGVILDKVPALPSFWRPDTFHFFPVFELIQEQAWSLWCQSNEAFCKYWVKHFGEFNECWKPPVKKQDIKLLCNSLTI